ncbi:MAG: hypothetical protein AB1631_18770 [Acidobacteriota bacterium]
MSARPHTSNWTDWQLAARCSLRPADETAWQEFVRRFHPMIRASVLKTLSLNDSMESGAVEELIQAVYRRLIEDQSFALKEAECACADSMRKYLMLISIRVVRDHLKKRPRFDARLN